MGHDKPCRTKLRSRPKSSKVARHIREHGPTPGCDHVWQQLIALDELFPRLTYREFVIACGLASAEGQA